ncbi:MAG: glucose-6-phosphate dehydrogenase [Acidobacteriota bacterium]|nr:glucose-6-phosphate dehydrogenase [Acidobacteriota bacterium]
MHQHQVPSRFKAKIIPVSIFDFVVFGGTGDLALRKLMPSLYYRDKDGQIPTGSRIIGASRSDMDRAAYIAIVKEHLVKHVRDEDFNEECWAAFAERLDYVSTEVPNGWQNLKQALAADGRIRVFYLSVPPGIFGSTCGKIHQHKLIDDQTRVVIEKPIGRDLETSCEINDSVGNYFHEGQIYRIDHYLGKETVQNLMALRFANSLFEPLWTRNWIDHIQITVAESIGIGTRGGYYDKSGALRDMVQNHILQLLCLVAMETPKEFGANEVRDEKLKVLRALRKIGPEDFKSHVVMGRYREGAVGGRPVIGYMEEKGIPEDSRTESYVAIKAHVDNWRWAGVPFYLRTGKRMPRRTSEIVIQFKKVPHLIFPRNADEVAPNRMVIRLQPDEGIRLYLMTKVPGPGGFRMQPTPLDLSFAEAFKMRYPDGYERLVMDVVRGNQTLFMRRDEVEAAWMWADTILNGWDNLNTFPQSYTAGTWGPSAAIALIERDGRTWYESEKR